MTLFCPIRKESVTTTPEEQVRQALISYMLNEGGYPLSLMAVEKSLAAMPHLQQYKLPNRRADLIVFLENSLDPFSYLPLLLIECKAAAFKPNIFQQLIGYNHFIQAPFIAIANFQEVRTGFWSREEGKWIFRNGLPSYAQMKGLVP